MKKTEIEASKFDLNYISLDEYRVHGERGGSHNSDDGHRGGTAFLDVGGGRRQGHRGFQDHLERPQRPWRLRQYFRGIISATLSPMAWSQQPASSNDDSGCRRLAGTNVELGQKILAESGLALIPASDMADGAKKIVAAIADAN